MKKFRITRSRGWNRPRNGFILTLTHCYPQFRVQPFLPSPSPSVKIRTITLNITLFSSRRQFYPKRHPITLNTQSHSFHPSLNCNPYSFSSSISPYSSTLTNFSHNLIRNSDTDSFSPPVSIDLHSFSPLPVFPSTSPRVGTTSYLTLSILPSFSPWIPALFYSYLHTTLSPSSPYLPTLFNLHHSCPYTYSPFISPLLN